MKRLIAIIVLSAGLQAYQQRSAADRASVESSVAVRQGDSSSSSSQPMWSGPRPHGPLKPFVLDVIGTPKRNDGTLDPAITFHDTLEKLNWKGHRAMRRVAATTKPGEKKFTRWSTVVFNEKTLLPYYSEFRTSEGFFLRREYEGTHVRETTTVWDFHKPLVPGTEFEIAKSEFHLTEPAFAWAEGVGLPVLLALPLRKGLQGSVPVISGSSSTVTPCFTGSCSVARLTYRVVGQETISGISGKSVLTWKVSVPETGFYFWIACQHPRLEGVTWPRSAGLTTRGQPDATFSMSPSRN